MDKKFDWPLLPSKLKKITNLIADIITYFIAAVIAVPSASRLGLRFVLEYLAAGIVIGPRFGLEGAETQEI